MYNVNQTICSYSSCATHTLHSLNTASGTRTEESENTLHFPYIFCSGIRRIFTDCLVRVVPQEYYLIVWFVLYLNSFHWIFECAVQWNWRVLTDFFLFWNLKSVYSLSSVSYTQRVLNNCLVCEKPEDCLLNTEYLIRLNLCNKLNPYATECNYCYFCKHSCFYPLILKLPLKMCIFFWVTETADRHPLCMLIWLGKIPTVPLKFYVIRMPECWPTFWC